MTTDWRVRPSLGSVLELLRTVREKVRYNRPKAEKRLKQDSCGQKSENRIPKMEMTTALPNDNHEKADEFHEEKNPDKSRHPVAQSKGLRQRLKFKVTLPVSSNI
ncbi:hypothetical protein GCM10023212_04820 [Luteolibacter yonseiensis]